MFTAFVVVEIRCLHIREPRSAWKRGTSVVFCVFRGKSAGDLRAYHRHTIRERDVSVVWDQVMFVWRLANAYIYHITLDSGVFEDVAGNIHYGVHWTLHTVSSSTCTRMFLFYFTAGADENISAAMLRRHKNS